MVPDDTIGFAPPAVTQIPFITPRDVRAVEFVALRTWPWELIVRVGWVYVPAVTPVGEMAMTPSLVITPPVNPVLAVMLQTVPDGGLDEIAVMRP